MLDHVLISDNAKALEAIDKEVASLNREIRERENAKLALLMMKQGILAEISRVSSSRFLSMEASNARTNLYQ